MVESVTSLFVDQGGRDILHGGDGNDLLLGGAGGDDLNGEAGDDTQIGDSATVELSDGLVTNVTRLASLLAGTVTSSPPPRRGKTPKPPPRR